MGVDAGSPVGKLVKEVHAGMGERHTEHGEQKKSGLKGSGSPRSRTTDHDQHHRERQEVGAGFPQPGFQHMRVSHAILHRIRRLRSQQTKKGVRRHPLFSSMIRSGQAIDKLGQT